MAPRSSWKGYLKLSLVSCPVRLYNATTSTNRITFHWLHKDTQNRVQMKPVDPELGQVERADLVKGYEFEKDRYVMVTEEDLEAVQIESTKTIAIEKFIDASEVDPIYLDSPYYIAPDGPVADETYRVIREAMRRRGKAALARVVLSSRERLVVVEARDKGLTMTTLRSAAEVRGHEEYFSEVGDDEVDAEAMGLAEMIIDQHAGSFDSEGFEDRYQTALLGLVKAKLKGAAPVVAKAPERGNVVNLMDALKQSLEERSARKPPAKSKRRASGAKKAKPRAVRSRSAAKVRKAS